MPFVPRPSGSSRPDPAVITRSDKGPILTEAADQAAQAASRQHTNLGRLIRLGKMRDRFPYTFLGTRFLAPVIPYSGDENAGKGLEVRFRKIVGIEE